MHKKGIALTAVNPELEREKELFFKALDVAVKYDIQVIEYYTEDFLVEEYGKAVKEYGFESVFISALDQKRNPVCNIASVDEKCRQASVDIMKYAIDKAIRSGAERAILQSGKAPKSDYLEVAAMRNVMRSFTELSEFTKDALMLSIEPCDRCVESRQLCGPAMQIYTMMKGIKLPYNNLELTMDTAHSAELLEDPIEAIRLCKPFCHHIHLANCAMNENEPLFGDKHLDFLNPVGELSGDVMIQIFDQVNKLYEQEELIITFEAAAHEKEAIEGLSYLINGARWFFEK